MGLNCQIKCYLGLKYIFSSYQFRGKFLEELTNSPS